MAKFTQDRMFEMLGDIVKPGKKKHAKTFRNNGDINDGGPTSPEEWRQQIKDIERQIGNPSGWTLSDYNTLQNKLNEYKSWRENTPEGQAVIDYHNQEGEYKIPLPEHLQDYTNAVMKSKLAYANEFGNPAAKRMINIPDNPYQFDNGDTGSHYMASYDNYAVPQIQDKNGVLQLGNYGPESNEAIRFDSDEDANYFAENYKNVSPGFLNQKQYGGLQKFVVGGQPPCGPDEAPDPKTGLCTAVAMTQNLPEADVYSKASTRKLQGTLTDKLQQMRNAFQNSRASNMKDGDKYNFGLNLGDETNDVRELPGRIERYRQAIELEKTKFAKDSYTLNQLKQYDPEHWDLKDQSKRFQRKPYEARSAEGLAALRSAVKRGAMSQEDFMYAYNDWGKHVDQNAVQGKGPGAVYNNKAADEIWGDNMNKEFFNPLAYGIAGTLGVIGGGLALSAALPAIEAAGSGISAGISAFAPVYNTAMSTPILGTANSVVANAAPVANMVRTALTGNNLAKAYGITKSAYDLLDGSTYDANKKVITDAAKGEFNVGNVATAVGKDLGLVSTVSNFIPQVNNYAGYIPKAVAKVGTGHALESPYSVNTVIKGVIDANEKLSKIAIKQEGGVLLNKKVTCKSCGWQWDAADGGNDVTTCHKCGGQGLVHAQYGGLHKFVGGGDPGDGSFGEAYRKAAYGSTFWWNGKRFKKDLENDIAAGRQRVIDKNPVFWNHVKNEINASNKDKYDNRGNLLYVGKDLENYNTRSLNDRIDLHINSGNPNITIGNPNSPFGLGRAFFTNTDNTMNLYGWDEDTKVNSSLLMDDYREELLHARQLKDWGIERFNEHQREDFDRHNIYWDPITETWINYKENYDSQMYDDPNSIEGVHNAQSEGLKSRLNRNFDVEEKNDINNKTDRLYNITPYITGEKSFGAYENQGDLRQLQKVLDEYGYDLSNSIKKDGTYDGIYGEETQKAFEKYKKDYQQGQLKPTINQKNDIVPTHLKDKNAEAYVKTLPKDKEVPKKISTIDKTKSTLFKLGVRSWNSMKYGGDVLDDNERLHKFVGGGPTDCKQGEYWNGTKCVPTYGINPSFSNNALTNNVNGINTKIAETKKKGMVYQSTADELNELYKQKADEAKKEAKRKELEAQERQRQQQLRTVGSDNTRVDNSITKNYNANYQLPYERAETITKAQKDAARQIVLSGDFGNYFPEQMDYYLSTENSHRQGGPLTLEELALQQIRTNPDFFQILEEKKYQDFLEREQKAYDKMPWYMKGVNTLNALAADPLTTLERGLLEWERPLAFQGLQSTNPSAAGEYSRFYDRALNRDNNVLNNTLNYINPFRAASSAGQNLSQGDYADAAVDIATILPMLKGAKAGWRGFTGLNNALNTGINTGLTKAGTSSLVQAAKAGWRAPLPLGKTITNATAGSLTPGAALGLGFGIHGALNAPEDLNRFIANPNLDTGVDLGMSTLEILTSPGMGNAMKFGVKGVKDLAKLFSTDSKAVDAVTNINQSGLIPISNKSVSPISFESVPQRGPNSYQIKMNNEWIGDFDLEKDFTNKANGNWVIGNVYLKEGYQGQGLGKESFIQANKLLESQGKGTLHSSGYFNGSQAKNVWESLVKEGKAEKIGKDAWKFKSTKSSSSSKNSFNASNSDAIDPANTGAPLDRFIEKKYLSKEEAEALKLANPQMKTKLIKEAKINGTLLPERFPMTIEGQQQAFDDATDFGLNWGLKDADEYNTIQSDFLALSERHSDLLKELIQYGSSTRFQQIDQKVSEIYANIMDEYLQLENITVDDYLRSGDPQHYQEFFANKRAEIIAENSQKSIDLQKGESYRNKIAKLESEKQQLASDLQLLHDSKQSQIDPTFKEKVQNLYREAGIPEMQIPKNAFYDGQGIPITNFGKNRMNLVEMNQLNPLSEPSFAALSDADQTYLANNWKKLNGVRTNDATITFQSKIYDDYYTERTAPKTTVTHRYEPAKEWHPLKPWTWKNYNSVGKHVREVNRGPYIDEPILIEKLTKIRENPTELAGVNVHEIGHDYQEFFQDWGKLLTEYDPQKGYYTGHSKNKLAKRFQNAMIKGKNITKEQLKKGDYNYDTWLSSPNELHSELMKARYNVYNKIKAEQPEMSQRDIINWIKEGEARGDDNIFDLYIYALNRHFKPETTNAEKKALIKLLPVLIPAAGFGVTKGMDNETPQNKYGGNVKTLSKFIKK